MGAADHLSRQFNFPGESEISEHTTRVNRLKPEHGYKFGPPRLTTTYTSQDLADWNLHAYPDFAGSTHGVDIESEGTHDFTDIRGMSRKRKIKLRSTFLHHPEKGWLYEGSGTHSGPAEQ